MKKICIYPYIVLGDAEQTHKFEIQLVLRNYFISNGYRISQVGSRHYSEFMGFHSLPGFLFSRNYLEYEKVFLFNQFIKEIEDSEKPDLIIIGIGGGILSLNNQFTNRFGFLAYTVCSALRPDIVIFSTLDHGNSPEYYTELNNLTKYHLGAEVDIFNLANMSLDWQYLIEMEKVKYIVHDYKTTIKTIRDYPELHIPVMNVLNTGDNRRFCGSIEKQLISCREVINV